MAGIIDGHNIETGSTPIDRLEEDIATQSELQDVINSVATEASTRAAADIVLQDNINALESDVNANYVHKTGNIAENINGVKTFLEDVTMSQGLTVSGDLNVQGTTTTIESVDLTVVDNIIILNNGETGAGVSASIAGIAIDRGPSDLDYRVIFDDTDDKIKAGFQGSEEPLATESYVNSQIGGSSGGLVALGTGAFPGVGNSPTTINFTPDLGVRPYSVNITPKESGGADIGEIYYTKVSGTQFTVHNTGDAVTDFDWSVGVVGVLPAASGVAGGDLSGSYPDPEVIKLRGRVISTAAPTEGQTLIWNSTTSQWTPSSSSGSPGGPATGDLNGTYPSPGVKALRGREVDNVTPSDGDVLTFLQSTGKWTPQAAPSGGGSDTLTGLNDVSVGLLGNQNFLSYDTASSRWINTELYLGLVSDVAVPAPNNNDVLTYNAATFRWEAKAPGSGSAGTIFAQGTIAATYSTNQRNEFVTGMLSTDIVLVSNAQGMPNSNQPSVGAVAQNGYFTVFSHSPNSLPANSIPPVHYVVIRP